MNKAFVQYVAPSKDYEELISEVKRVVAQMRRLIGDQHTWDIQQSLMIASGYILYAATENPVVGGEEQGSPVDRMMVELMDAAYRYIKQVREKDL